MKYPLLLLALASTSAAAQPHRPDQSCIAVLGDGGPATRICFSAPPTAAGGGRRSHSFARRPASTEGRLSGDAPASAVPVDGEAPRAAGPADRTAVRALILPNAMPPPGTPAYGLVAFPTLPLEGDTARFVAVCRAYKSTLVTREQAAPAPSEAQMITFWPVTSREGLDGDPPCDAMVARYDLKAGLDGIRDADTRRDGLAARRGPFLIAWSPSASRAKPDAVLLILDLTDLTSAESFQAVFVTWRQKILDDPKFWRNGFSLERVRLALRDALDTYGAQLMPLFKPDK